MFGCLKGKTPRVEPSGPIITIDSSLEVVIGHTRNRIKLAIIVGHNKKKQGADNYLGESEWVFNSRIARKLQVKLTALGIESVADTFTDILNESYGFKERRDDGVYIVGSRHNGFGMINAVNRYAISCLVEACFAGYKNKESELVFEHEDKYVDVFVKAIEISWTGGLVAAPVSVPDPIKFLDETKYSLAFSRLVHALKKSIQNVEFKSIILAQFILESGRGKSKLAKEFYNFGGLKWREEMRAYGSPISYEAWDGETDYIKFTSAEAFIRGYWAFIARSPYNGWERFKEQPELYIKFINECGYTPPLDYYKKVIALHDEAKELLR